MNRLRHHFMQKVYFLYHRLFYLYIRNVRHKKEIRFCGMMRTGNHALLNWIVKQTPAVVCYYNDVDLHSSPLAKMIESHYKNRRQPAREKSHKLPTVICSFEDYLPRDVFGGANLKNLKTYFRKSDEVYNVLILRDPFNLFASRFFHRSSAKAFRKNPQKLFDLADKWKIFAKEFLGETQYIKNNKVTVNYNQWTTDKNYRERLASTLKIPFTDAGFDKVASHGQGSSFSKTSETDATKLDVFNRWKKLRDDALYRRIFEDRELVDLSKKIFGHLEGTEVLFNR